jgi:hypothetical protein
MGKHVPGGNLFPTVRTRRPTEKRVYLSTDTRMPTDLPTDIHAERVYLPTDRSNDDRLYISIGRLHRTAT